MAPSFTRLVGNNSTGSGFTGGGISFVDKDLSTLSGSGDITAPLDLPLCGNGDLADCRDSLWAAMQAAGDQIAQETGTDNPFAWTSDATAERISFAPGLLKTTIRYTNRPSGIQQVIDFVGHRAAAGAAPAATAAAAAAAAATAAAPATPARAAGRTRSPKVVLTFGRFRLSSTGRTSVTVRCPRTSTKITCTGFVTVRRRGRIVERVNYTLSSGAKKKIGLKMPTSVRRVVKRNGRTLLRVEVRGRRQGAADDADGARRAAEGPPLAERRQACAGRSAARVSSPDSAASVT